MGQALRELMKDELLESEKRGEQRGEQRGEKKGKMLALCSLVKQGLLSIQLAAKQAGMTEAEFAAAMG